MNLQDVHLLIDFHGWARDRMLDAVAALPAEQFTRDLGNSFPSVRDTVAHIYGADWIWCSRWEGETPAGLPDPKGFADVASLRGPWNDVERRVRALVGRLGEPGMQRPMEYRRKASDPPQSQIFWQMLQHVVNHGTYHRGQVTTMLRQLGANPPKSMDLIAFYRERASAS